MNNSCLILTNRDDGGVEIVGTLGESNCVILEFNILQVQVIAQSQTGVLDVKKADFNKLKRDADDIKLGRIANTEDRLKI